MARAWLILDKGITLIISIMNYLESQKNVVMVTKVIDFSPDSLQMNCPKYLHIRGFKSWPSQTVVGVM